MASMTNDNVYSKYNLKKVINASGRMTILGVSTPRAEVVDTVAQTIVVTILAPQGVVWDKNKNEVANVIFLLAISKDEYEDAMSIYNLFVNFVKEKSTKRLLNSRSFGEFQAIVKDSFGRIA